MFELDRAHDRSLRAGCYNHLVVDLDALVRNFEILRKAGAPAKCAPAVKGNAYGVGIVQATRALLDAGAGIFFVAHPSEGIAIRKLHSRPKIYVLNGYHSQSAEIFLEHRLSPVLGSDTQISAWLADRAHGAYPQPAIHIDTGISRLGIPDHEIHDIPRLLARIKQCDPALIMSHFACADDSAHPSNQVQLARFEAICTYFPGAEYSMANSAAIFGLPKSHYDITRPGIALYGGKSRANEAPLEPVASMYGMVNQIKTLRAGEKIGYGETYAAKSATRLAVVSLGYADGVHRLLSSDGQTAKAGCVFGGAFLPLIGRVSMDFITLDATQCSELKEGDWVEIFGKNQPVQQLAKQAQTLDYELLTHMGRRLHRNYVASGKLE